MSTLIHTGENTIINLDAIIIATYNPAEPVRSLVVNIEADRSMNFAPCQAAAIWQDIESAAREDDELLLVYSSTGAAVVNTRVVSTFEWLGDQVRLRVLARTYRIGGEIGREIWAALEGVFEHV